MASVGTAVPGNVNLAKQKPYAVSAYSRRVKSLANNAQSFGPDSYVNITLDTSTPGSFLDPLQSYLKFDLTIRNSSVFADFVSFGQAGAASLIEEFRIYVQGTPIEEILQYNVFYEMAMNQNAQCQQPYYLFRPNQNAQPISQLFATNAIKPPMVDIDGRPMYGRVSKPENYHGISYAASSANGLLQAKIIQSQASYSSKVCFSGCRPFFTSGIGSNTPNLICDASSLLYGSQGVSAATGDVLISNNTTQGQELFPGLYRANTGVVTAQTATSISTLSAANLTGVAGLQNGFNGYESIVTNAGTGGNSIYGEYLRTASGGILPYAGSSVQFPSSFNSTAAEVDPDSDPLNPLNWPDILPPSVIRPDLKSLGPENLQDYFMFLSNCKYLPIGLPGWNKADPASWDPNTTIPTEYTITSNNFRNLREYKGASNEKAFTYTCCIPLISGILGSFAEKCWPTMLVAPGSMYIQIRTATPQKAFQLSMDPCRRVLGTIRDYLPFGGSMGGVFGQVGASSNTTTNLLGTNNAGSSLYNGVGSGAFSSLNVVGYLPRNTFSEYVAVSSFDEIGGAITSTTDPRNVQSTINAYACIGSTLSSVNANYNNQFLGSSTIKGFGLLFRPYSVAAMEGRWTIGRAYVTQPQISFISGASAGASGYKVKIATEEAHNILPSTAGSNIVPNNTQALVSTTSTLVNPLNSRHSTAPLNGGSVTLASVCPRTAIAIGAFGAANVAGSDDTLYNAAAGFSPDGDVTVEFAPSGIPLPQYWLHAAPWSVKSFAVAFGADSGNTVKQFKFLGMPQIDACSESAACYGTFLNASVPQCRRLFTNYESNAGAVTYTLSNIEFVSQQIILPDSVSASILEDAAQGDISISSNSVHNFQTPIAQSTSQNLIIPAKIASANTMFCIFQPQAFVAGNEAFCYNSLRGICPFGSVSAAAGMTRGGLVSAYGTTALGYDAGQLRVENIPCTSGVMQVQLKIGNELVPQQPLTTLNEVLTENVKAMHKLFDTNSNINANFMISTKSIYELGGNETTALSYDVISPDTFATTFVSAELMDDQTAINNPSSMYVYACEANRLNNATLKPSAYVIPRKKFGFEVFQPPSSTFVLSFDLDTWSRYSDVTRSGKFLGNNTITLTMQNAAALGYAPSQTLSGGYVLQTFIVHDIRFSFQAGGSVVSYY